MDNCSITDAPFGIADTDTVITVQNLNIFVAEIVRIPVDETIVAVLYRIIFNAVAVCNVDLYAIVTEIEKNHAFFKGNYRTGFGIGC